MDTLRKRYLEALSLENVAEVARVTGRGRRTFVAYRNGERRVTERAAKELIAYLRDNAHERLSAAEALEEALQGREERDE